MPQRRRSFTPEFRSKAAHMVIDEHRRVAEVSRELDLNKDLLHTWVRDERWRMTKSRGAVARRMDDPAGGQPLSVQERAELVRLRAIIAQQAREIAFLEEVSAHFAAAASKVSRLELTAAECACHDVPAIAQLPDVSSSGSNCQRVAKSDSREMPMPGMLGGLWDAG